VVRLVRHEIAQHVAYVEREIAPDVGRGTGDRAAPVTTQDQQAENAAATPVQGLNQLRLPNSSTVDAPGHGDSQFLT